MTTPTYFLHVDITLQASTQKRQFEQAVIAFLNEGGFPALAKGPSLTPSNLLRAVEAKGGTPEAGHVHLWNVPNIQSLDLAQLMNASRDNVAYKAVDRYVHHEQQNFIYYDPLHAFQPPDWPKSPRFVRVTHEFPKTTNYGEYSTYAVLLVIYLALAGWRNCGIFWNVTGRLNTFTEIWCVDATKGPKNDADIVPAICAALAKTYPKNDGRPGYIDLVQYYHDLPHTSPMLLEEYAVQDTKSGQWQWVPT